VYSIHRYIFNKFFKLSKKYGKKINLNFNNKKISLIAEEKTKKKLKKLKKKILKKK